MEARVVYNGKKSVYIFCTENKREGFGLLLLEGIKDSLPTDVQAAYDAAAIKGDSEAAKEKRDGYLATNQWLSLKDSPNKYALVRSNGQVIFCEVGSQEADQFDPLQGVRANAARTKEQEAKGDKSWKTLKDIFSGNGAEKFERVKWNEKGAWEYISQDVLTVGPTQGEPAPP